MIKFFEFVDMMVYWMAISFFIMRPLLLFIGFTFKKKYPRDVDDFLVFSFKWGLIIMGTMFIIAEAIEWISSIIELEDNILRQT